MDIPTSGFCHREHEFTNIWKSCDLGVKSGFLFWTIELYTIKNYMRMGFKGLDCSICWKDAGRHIESTCMSFTYHTLLIRA